MAAQKKESSFLRTVADGATIYTAHQVAELKEEAKRANQIAELNAIRIQKQNDEALKLQKEQNAIAEKMREESERIAKAQLEEARELANIQKEAISRAEAQQAREADEKNKQAINALILELGLSLEYSLVSRGRDYCLKNNIIIKGFFDRISSAVRQHPALSLFHYDMFQITDAESKKSYYTGCRNQILKLMDIDAEFATEVARFAFSRDQNINSDFVIFVFNKMIDALIENKNIDQVIGECRDLVATAKNNKATYDASMLHFDFSDELEADFQKYTPPSLKLKDTLKNRIADSIKKCIEENGDVNQVVADCQSFINKIKQRKALDEADRAERKARREKMIDLYRKAQVDGIGKLKFTLTDRLMSASTGIKVFAVLFFIFHIVNVRSELQGEHGTIYSIMSTVANLFMFIRGDSPDNEIYVKIAGTVLSVLFFLVMAVLQPYWVFMADEDSYLARLTKKYKPGKENAKIIDAFMKKHKIKDSEALYDTSTYIGSPFPEIFEKITTAELGILLANYSTVLIPASKLSLPHYCIYSKYERKYRNQTEQVSDADALESFVASFKYRYAELVDPDKSIFEVEMLRATTLVQLQERKCKFDEKLQEYISSKYPNLDPNNF